MSSRGLSRLCACVVLVTNTVSSCFVKLPCAFARINSGRNLVQQAVYVIERLGGVRVCIKGVSAQGITNSLARIIGKNRVLFCYSLYTVS